VNPSNLHQVNRGFVPFYQVPVGHVFEVWVTWQRQPHPDLLKKIDSVTGRFLAAHTARMNPVTMDEKELVRDLTNENITTHQS
jgi:hypothetical protein